MDTLTFLLPAPLRDLLEAQHRPDPQSVSPEQAAFPDESLQIVDISLLSNFPPERHLDWRGEKPIVAALRDLPPQSPSACRMYFTSGLDGCDEVTEHVRGLIGDGVTTLFAPIQSDAPRSYRNISHRNDVPWWHKDLCLFSQIERDNSRRILDGLVQCPIRARCYRHEDGRVFCFFTYYQPDPCAFRTAAKLPTTPQIHDELERFANTIMYLDLPQDDLKAIT
ncbi:hypothetical protein BJY00DRAFT_311710 [Aspergillus carlsbadensis]|nr:hypothetical protein BJY00DRAFT_311710 [Aspergillus carlsbadensis]